jgi:hypothetical protein
MGHNVMATLLLFHCSNSQVIIGDFQVCLHLCNRIVGDRKTEPAEVQRQYNCILEGEGVPNRQIKANGSMKSNEDFQVATLK